MTEGYSHQKIENLLQEIPCNFCHSHAYSVVYERTYHLDDPAEEILKQFRSCGGDVLLDQVVQCNTCGLRFINPRLQDDCLLSNYADGTIQGYKEQFVSQNRGREIAFERSIKMINSLLPAKGKLLDVGTAAGTFMAIAKKHGWDVRGCEPNAWFCQWGKDHYNLDIDQGTLFEQNYADGSFDIITLWDVIEHVPDPMKVLTACSKLLRPGGVLICTFPDINSWIARLMGRRWVFLMSVHLYYFTKTTFGNMAKTVGLDVVNSTPHFQTLQLGYIIYRIKIHSRVLHKLLKTGADLLRLNNVMFPYWVGIHCVIAKKSI